MKPATKRAPFSIFRRRPIGESGVIGSFCLNCCVYIAYSTNREALRIAERVHRCDTSLLARLHTRPPEGA